MPLLLGGKIGRPLERPRRHVVSASVARPQAGLLQCGAGGVVGTERAEGEVPRPAVSLGVRKDVGEGAMAGPAPSRVGVPVHGCADEGMAELDPPVGDIDKPLRLGGSNPCWVEPQHASSPGHRCPLSSVARRREQEELLG